MQALTVADLTTLDQKQPVPSVIKRIRDHHHALARLVAQGKRTGEIARETGMSLSRISILKGDPTFQQLVAHYREQVNVIEMDLYAQMRAREVARYMLATEEEVERLMEMPETFSARDLADIRADAADRLGMTKVTRSENVQWKGDLADGLAEARRRRDVLLSASPSPPEQRGDAEKQESVSSTPAEPPTPAGEGD